MSNSRTVWGVILVMAWVVIASAVTGVLMRRPAANAVATSNVAYDRIMRSNTIRAAYVIYPPGSIKDSKTNQLTGIFVDTLNEAAKNMGLKVDWTEEVGWSTMIEGLKENRYDIVGSAVWPTSSRGKLVDFTTPLTYSVLGAYVRDTDNRFDADITKLNDSGIKAATIDGEISSIVAQNSFPKATLDSLPQLSDISQALLDVSSKKADVAFVEPYIADKFMQDNPGSKLKNLAAAKPLLVYGNSMMINKNEPSLKSILDTAFDELINSGYVDSEIAKYSADYPHAYYLANYPYRIPAGF